ncbi:MAG: hypothetical protein IIB87_07480, partial [Chloroflexi bacterium]|nr:hypothetical protein [Chloroflexota bacterium]
MDREKSVLDDVLKALREQRDAAGAEDAEDSAADDDALDALLASGTIGDVFRALRDKTPVRAVV